MVDSEEPVVSGGTELIGSRTVTAVDSEGPSDTQVRSCSDGRLHAEAENLEPHDGIEFESNEAAYSFYQEYAKSMGFTISIKNSRRSKRSKDFIDAKFACSRYGVTPEQESGSSRRPTVKKTACKASMHVKRRWDGKWYIHEFVKEHNHELLPALAYHFRIRKNVKLSQKNNIDILHAISERTKKIYVEMSRQSGGCPDDSGTVSQNEFEHQLDRDRYLPLEEGDAQVMMECFMQIQRDNPRFFYAVDLNRDQKLRNLFWVDAKHRQDYISFSDVVFFDTSYVRTIDKMSIVLFLGVNHHCQPILLGFALLSDESKPTFVWLMKTWLRAMGGQAPEVIITDQDKQLKSAIEEVFPYSRHCYPLWHILQKIPETLTNVLRQHDNFMRKFTKCIFKSLTDEEFDMRWWKMVSKFDLQENEWIHAIYLDRKKWVPAFMRDTFLAGMSMSHRSESVNSLFDKYIHKKTNLKEFVRQYRTILQNRYEEEEMADFDTCHKQPALKSPSPWEKQMSTIYTHAIFRKFQVEVLGVVGCHPKEEGEKDLEGNVIFNVNDCEKNDNFMVMWNEVKSEVSCSCLMFEHKGFLCRHSMNVLQMCGRSSIPSQYILKRWTKDAKSRQAGAEKIQTRVQRYNDLCKRAIELGEEGSLNEKSYTIACRALVDGLKDCVNINNRAAGESNSDSVALRCARGGSQLISITKQNKKRSANKKRKIQPETEAVAVEAQESLQQMENSLTSEGISLNGYYGSQQHTHGLLNLMEPPHDAYYVGQPTMQGLGQLSSITSSHDGFYAAQSVPGLGHLDFRQPGFGFSLQDEHNVRSVHGTARNS